MHSERQDSRELVTGMPLVSIIILAWPERKRTGDLSAADGGGV